MCFSSFAFYTLTYSLLFSIVFAFLFIWHWLFLCICQNYTMHKENYIILYVHVIIISSLYTRIERICQCMNMVEASASTHHDKTYGMCIRKLHNAKSYKIHTNINRNTLNSVYSLSRCGFVGKKKSVSMLAKQTIERTRTHFISMCEYVCVSIHAYSTGKRQGLI